MWPAEAAVLKVTKAKFFLNLQSCLQLHSLSPRLATELEFLLLEVSLRKQSLFPKANDKDQLPPQLCLGASCTVTPLSYLPDLIGDLETVVAKGSCSV